MAQYNFLNGWDVPIQKLFTKYPESFRVIRGATGEGFVFVDSDLYFRVPY